VSVLQLSFRRRSPFITDKGATRRDDVPLTLNASSPFKNGSSPSPPSLTVEAFSHSGRELDVRRARQGHPIIFLATLALGLSA
jgi:hypothetical protein